MKQFFMSRKAAIMALAACAAAVLIIGGKGAAQGRGPAAENISVTTQTKSGDVYGVTPKAIPVEAGLEPAAEERPEEIPAEQPAASAVGDSSMEEKESAPDSIPASVPGETEAEVPVTETIEEAKARFAEESEEMGSGYTIVISADVVEKRLREKYLVDGQYPTTDEGLTYGPFGLIDGVHPDLVGVIATNGNSGYAKYEEWDPYGALLSNPNTTPEKLAYAKAHLDDYSDTVIPVYDLEGNVIGEFITYCTQSNVDD